jgi:hypothetical protein
MNEAESLRYSAKREGRMARKELLNQVTIRNNFPLPDEAQHLQVWLLLSGNAP